MLLPSRASRDRIIPRMIESIDQTVAWLGERVDSAPDVLVILGSGLGGVVGGFEIEQEIPYSDIPHAPVSGVRGHSGKLVFASSKGRRLAILQGRVHYYEGFSMPEVVFLPRVIGRMGAKVGIVTNAAGGINVDFAPGDLMIISDHLNYFGDSPLRGSNMDDLGLRFPDLSEPYPESLRGLVKEICETRGIAIKEGVYAGLPGPSYETPAEIRALRILGADAVGMSTVPEVIALAHMEIPVIGVSCITNMAAGILPRKLTHEEVIETTARVEQEFRGLLLDLIERLPAGRRR